MNELKKKSEFEEMCDRLEQAVEDGLSPKGVREIGAVLLKQSYRNGARSGASEGFKAGGGKRRSRKPASH